MCHVGTARPKTSIVLNEIPFSALAGWRSDRLEVAFAAFLRSCEAIRLKPPRSRPLAIEAAALRDICAAARSECACAHDRDRARHFFETHFRPYRISGPAADAHFTSYYEPEVAGALTRTDTFNIPLLARPENLVSFESSSGVPRPRHLPSSLLRGWRNNDGSLSACPDRQAIDAGALDDENLALVWLESPIDAYFIHIQGSARVHLAGGRVMRLGYADKNGYPYTSIGQYIRRRGILPADNITLESVTAWLQQNPAQRDTVLWQNRSYIFFREIPALDPALGPKAAAQVQLTRRRSLAVDRLYYGFHSPFWVDVKLPRTGMAPFRRLMVAQDTGSAIVGPKRADIYLGTGEVNGRRAGRINHFGTLIQLRPPGPGRIEIAMGST